MNGIKTHQRREVVSHIFLVLTVDG
jgi:hypothetical protein